MSRKYFDRWSDHSSFNRVVAYINENKKLNGVNNIYQSVKQMAAVYDNEILAVCNKYEAQLDEKEALWQDNYKKRRQYTKMTVWCFVTIFVISMVDVLLRRNENYSVVLQMCGKLLDFLLVVIGVLVVLVFIYMIKEKWHEKQFIVKMLEAERCIDSIDTKYRERANRLYKALDNLYLDSLEPAVRESVIMRRDMERQHQERLELIRQHQKEQEEIRKVQEKLLKIEEERERREKEKSRYY